MRDPDSVRRIAIRAKYREMGRKGIWSYSDRYDAYYETKTRKWIENKCRDRDCEFCVWRPKLAPIRRIPAASSPHKEK